MGEEEVKQTEEVKVEAKYELVKVPTGEALAIQTPGGEYIGTEHAIVEVLNIVKSIETEIGKA